MLFLIAVAILLRHAKALKPNVVFFLADDAGWSDFAFSNAQSSVPTPTLDALASVGIKFTQYYSHTLCTPARASLLTGRYGINVGLNFILTLGTPAGLPVNVQTLPECLKNSGYSTAMVGKWHLGHAQHKMTPVGRGFESFTGNLLWDIDSYSKQMYEGPLNRALLIDWIQEFENGTYRHYAEPRHATEAITIAAQEAIINHAKQHEDKSLFLYVAFTAPHSPLQPLPYHVSKCQHIAHPWRKDYCGMVVGMDESIRNITESMLYYLGENTIVVFTSDNGGSPWFGGNNMPFRGSKGTPYEGGARVPALLVDFSRNQEYTRIKHERQSILDSPTRLFTHTLLQSPEQSDKLINAVANRTNYHSNSNARIFPHLMHVSDWMPTLLSYADIRIDDRPPYIDGYDMSLAIKILSVDEENDNISDVSNENGHHNIETISNNLLDLKMKLSHIMNHESLTTDRLIYNLTSSNSMYNPRQEIFYDLYHEEDTLFHEELAAYRIGDWKLIRGVIRDDNYYYETSSSSYLNISKPTIYTNCIETLIHIMERLLGASRFDSARLAFTHVTLQDTMTYGQKSGKEPTLRLYNIHYDPYETTNLAKESYATAIIQLIEDRINYIDTHRTMPIQKVYLKYDTYSSVWSSSYVPGDCSMNKNIRPEDCRFTHSWIPDVSARRDGCI